jgi:hypothetical protein
MKVVELKKKRWKEIARSEKELEEMLAAEKEQEKEQDDQVLPSSSPPTTQSPGQKEAEIKAKAVQNLMKV